MENVLFFDLETEPGKPAMEKSGSKIKDIGAWYNGSHFHDSSIEKFEDFSQDAQYICGHNIFLYDLPILKENHMDEGFFKKHCIDTLYLSALLFPQNPYHKLVKDYKLISREPNNPVSDSKLAMELLKDCIRQFQQLDNLLKQVYCCLLKDVSPFKGFLTFYKQKFLRGSRGRFFQKEPPDLIKNLFKEKLCINRDFEGFMEDSPIELAYTLALFTTDGSDSITPPWLVHQYPEILQVSHRLRYNRCSDANCTYCSAKLDAGTALKSIFGFDNFLRFEDDAGIPLQEKAVNAALDGQSFLAIFPTGGGKSLTFQLPALMKGEACRSLTVVISPLQSLMKDQVDILKDRHERTDAAAINGLLSPLERAEAIKKVESGSAHILYISPESLRSNTILRIIKNRIIDRFVIDEAHCFSSWGQDFRVDYQYIGEFMKLLMKEKNLIHPIPVSCFTATAKPSVIHDIKNYFREKLGLELEIFKTTPKRKNLSYGILYAATAHEKFSLLLNLLSQDNEPKIVYTTRVRSSEVLAERLKDNGFNAAAYNGRMKSEAKIKIQNQFMSGSINIIVATSAFGMGIDKDDVSMVVHYNISDSLENYMQEAGRAGRSKEIKATCYVLFDDSDLMAHFSLLNATRINKKEIYQVWQGIKKIRYKKFSRSALELAKAAGWDTELFNCEMRVKTALAALEDCGLVKRGQDQTRVFATGLLVKNMEQASSIIRQYEKFDETDRLNAIRIIKFIISYRNSPVDFIADALGIKLVDTKRLINELKGLHIIGDDKDLTAYVNTDSKTGSLKIFEKFARLETKLLQAAAGDENIPVKRISLKQLNSDFRDANIDSDIESLRTVLFTWESRKWIKKTRIHRQNHIYQIEFKKKIPEVKTAVPERLELARHVLKKLIINTGESQSSQCTPDTLVEFSIGELRKFVEENRLFKTGYSSADYDRTLLYLNDISAIKLDKGLFVYYTPYSITRCSMDGKRQYRNEDYRKFDTFYRHKIEQIHIVGEYAKKLAHNYKEAMVFIDDYFSLDYPAFIKKYFPRRTGQIQKPITEKQFNEIFKELSPEQMEIIKDNKSRAILVAAGPGSGKTRVLIHKVASLLTLEDVKTEQFLMLTYSRSAALEMKERLRGLVKEAARYVDIYTFHSFAFNIAEIRGDLEQAADIIPRAVKMISSGKAAYKVENKSVLVVDEFQDIGSQEFELIRAIIKAAKEIRVVAVGDDDQNIFEFRGSSSQYMKNFIETFRAEVYHLTTNYRSKDNLVQFSNSFVKQLPDRVKADRELVSAKCGQNGSLSITRYNSTHLLTPLVRDVIRCRSLPFNGTTAVLTATNDEALQVYTLLRQQGIRAKLLVSYTDIQLKCLVELNTFSHFITGITRNRPDKIIEWGQWQEAKKRIMQEFSRSKQLELALTVIETFETSYNERENLLSVNWREYLDEVKLEDFIFPDRDTVFVSTMHKAKGKEFDRVFLLLDNYKIVKDENIRVIYVAVTRAKESLNIHTNLSIFDDIWVTGRNTFVDDTVYTDPEYLCLQLTYRDVYLDYFTNELIIENLCSLQAGDRLAISERDPRIVYAGVREVLMFSTSALENLKKFFDKGYKIQSIHAEYIVTWKKKEEERQYRVVLPRLELEGKKRGQAGRMSEFIY